MLQLCLFLGFLGVGTEAGGLGSRKVGGIQDIELDWNSREPKYIFDFADWAAGQLCAKEELYLRCQEGGDSVILTQASAQVVAGTLYKLTMEIGQAKNECRAEVWSRPWLKKEDQEPVMLTKFKCHPLVNQ